MIKEKKILALIPARGGSKGIPRKNIRILHGKPLIAYSIQEAKKSKYIDRLILSSDDGEIINVAREYGCEVPFIRPKELALDGTSGIAPVIHAINTLDEDYDYLLLLQPTSPLRKVDHIDECIEKCILSDAESCVSVTEITKHPFWMYTIEQNMFMKPFIDHPFVSRRQDLPELFALNGALYISKINTLLKYENFITEKTIPYLMSKIDSMDIDDEFDFMLCDKIMAGQNE